MPVIKSAIKKLKQDKKRTQENDALRATVLRSIKVARKTPTEKNVSAAFSVIDKSVKKNLMHKNKAARIKSSLAKAKPQKTIPNTKLEVKKAPAKTVKKVASKTTPKTSRKAAK